MQRGPYKPKRRKGLIVLLILVILAFSNPSVEDYANWTIGDADGTLETFGAELLGKPLIKGMTTRNNLFIFSIFKTGALGVESKTVGFAKVIFINID